MTYSVLFAGLSLPVTSPLVQLNIVHYIFTLFSCLEAFFAFSPFLLTSPPLAHIETPFSNSFLLIPQGELLSVVQCCRCSYQRASQEPFLDLSLAFPPACHRGEQDACSLHDMLDLFSRGCADSEAEAEAVASDGNGEAAMGDANNTPDLTYECEVCNRGRAPDQPVRYTEVRQTLRVSRLPRVLRLHLKRFK